MCTYRLISVYVGLGVASVKTCTMLRNRGSWYPEDVTLEVHVCGTLQYQSHLEVNGVGRNRLEAFHLPPQKILQITHVAIYFKEQPQFNTSMGVA